LLICAGSGRSRVIRAGNQSGANECKENDPAHRSS
jgi:hypothetical protein